MVSITITNYTQAQTTTGIKGIVTDTLNKQNLYNAVISVLRPKDSVLVKYTRSQKNGQFELKGIPAGKYLVLVSYPTYADFIDEITVNPTDITELGKIPVITKANLLEEVVVRQKIAAIRMKGDTLEMKADSFKVGPNADVQELLRKMPGITVNSKGEITAQGQKVQKVLVDGEEFFSDDPAVVTKNLRADIVDKVQVYDKKSDQAVFTGIDDGEKAKTINLQLKEDKKKGYFGKIEAGSDFDRYRSGKAMLNVFKGKKKAAAYLTNDNTKFESLDWNERSNYGEDLNRTTQVNDDGGINIWSNGDAFSWGQGLPISTTAGLHFSNKWNKDKHNSINTYQYNDLRVTGVDTTITQSLIPGADYQLTKSVKDFNNFRKRNRMRSTYNWDIDSTSSLKIIATGSIINTNASSVFNSRTDNFKGQLINNSSRTTTDINEDQNLITNIFWRKRFKKKGRTISFSTDINVNSKKGTGFLFADNFFNTSTPITSRIDQLKSNDERLFGISGKISYTEPIWKNTFLELNYRYAFNKNNQQRNTLEGGINGAGKYDNLVDNLSNHFIFNNHNNTAGFNFKYNVKKYNFNIGSAVGSVQFNQQDVRKNTIRSISFTNFLPSAAFNYNIKKQTRLGFNYNGNTNNPTMQQINPIIDNIDPLNIVEGNPNLKQEFRHNFSLNFSDYKVLKDRNLYLSANFNFVNNAITNATTFDTEKGITSRKAINVNGNYNFNMWSSYGFQVAPSFNLNFDFNPGINRFVNVINDFRNVTDSRNLRFGVNSGYWGDKWLNYWFGFDATYNENKTTAKDNVKHTKFWSYSGNSDFDMKFKKIKMYVNLNTNITLFQKTAAFANARNIYVINASIRKSLDKAENWQIGIRGNDLLNQNQQVSRNIQSNFITETTQQNIRRFFMLQLTYNFSKNGKPTQGW